MDVKPPKLGDKVIYYPHPLHRFEKPMAGEVVGLYKNDEFLVDILIATPWAHIEKKVQHNKYAFDYMGEWVYNNSK